MFDLAADTFIRNGDAKFPLVPPSNERYTLLVLRDETMAAHDHTRRTGVSHDPASIRPRIRPTVLEPVRDQIHGNVQVRCSRDPNLNDGFTRNSFTDWRYS